jgi:exopolyphosphatase/guanosine-5'-triphosphate,3'-diphosphate pyrophosphatase
MAIVPRWEWRTFGEHFGAAEERFAELSPELVEESDELYVLSKRGRDTVKVRDELIDVKHLEQVNEDGLEQWTPVLKGAFPLSAEVVRSVLAVLRADSAELGRSAYTLRELLDDVVLPNDDLRAVETHKLRRHYTVDGCMAELTDVRSDGASTRTVAIESEDAARVIATVRELGLDSRPNTSFPRGLGELVGLGAGHYAVIDVGTNSVKFHLGERDATGRWRTLIDRAEITRLGEGLEERTRLEPGPMERTVEAVAAMADEARRSGAVPVAVGTAGLRIASNAAEFVAAVERRCGVAVEIISGEEEARLAYLAATSELGSARGSLAVFETGGGSSQFTFGHGHRVDDRFSVDVGAVRFTERYGLDRTVSEEALSTAIDAIVADLSLLDDRPRPEAVVGMGGAITNLAAVKHRLATYDPDVVQGTVLDCDEIDRQIELYRTSDAAERRAIVGLQTQRADIILAGACIVRTVLAKLDAGSLTVSDRGLRHGLLIERFG